MSISIKHLCLALGGSHAYGLSTPASDKDYRGVFQHLELDKVLGINRFEHLETKNNEEDKFLFELRHFLCLARKTNTTVMELLFTDSFVRKTPEWELIQMHRAELIDSERFYKSLKGYIFGERRLMIGERTGQLGGKRKNAIDQFGYSPKNAVQLLRLSWCGKVFFQTGIFPVFLSKWNNEFAQDLLDIKVNPQKYTGAQMNEESLRYEEILDKAFAQRTIHFEFNEEAANQLIFEISWPVLKELRKNSLDFWTKHI